MTANRRIVQLSLISIGLFLILATYFLYPKLLKEKAIEDSMSKTDTTDAKEASQNNRNDTEEKALKGPSFLAARPSTKEASLFSINQHLPIINEL